MRRTLIPIAVGVGLGVFVAGILAYFSVAKQSTYWVDGLGRPLVSAPWVALLVFGTNKEWAGWTWFFLDLLWFWGGIGLAFFLGSLSGKPPNESKLPKALITIVGIVIALSAAYVTQRVIKMGVAFGLEAGLGFKPRVAAVSAAAKANLPFVEYQKWSRFTEREQESLYPKSSRDLVVCFIRHDRSTKIVWRVLCVHNVCSERKTVGF